MRFLGVIESFTCMCNEVTTFIGGKSDLGYIQLAAYSACVGCASMTCCGQLGPVVQHVCSYLCWISCSGIWIPKAKRTPTYFSRDIKLLLNLTHRLLPLEALGAM